MKRIALMAIATIGVALVALNAQTPRSASPLPSFGEPGISPDGSTIAFVSGGDIWEVSARGGDARLLVSHPATESRPLFAPDGKRLAFSSTRTGNGDVYVLTLASGELTRLTFDDANELVTGWSADGKWIYFSSTSHDLSGMQDVHRVSAEGGTPMPVAADRFATEYFASPPPSGETIAITARGNAGSQWWRKGHSHLDESEIWLVRDSVASGLSRTLTYTQLTKGGAKDAWPMWSADAKALYFMSDRSGAQNIWVQGSGVQGSGFAPKAVTTFKDGRVLWPSISRDGKTIAFAVHGEVFSASAKDGGDAARVTTTAGEEAELSWARQPAAGVPLGPRRHESSLPLRLLDGERDAADDRRGARRHPAIFAGRQVDRVRARLEGAAHHRSGDEGAEAARDRRIRLAAVFRLPGLRLVAGFEVRGVPLRRR